MLRIRDLTLAWLATNTPVIASVETIPGSGRTWKTINGTLKFAVCTASTCDPRSAQVTINVDVK